jgi:hypothetical protein
MKNLSAVITVQGIAFEVRATSDTIGQDFDQLLSELRTQLWSLPIEHVEMLRDELLIMSVSDRVITLDDINDAVLLKSLTGSHIAIRALDPVLAY